MNRVNHVFQEDKGCIWAVLSGIGVELYLALIDRVSVT
jgi:hypothetical protein